VSGPANQEYLARLIETDQPLALVQSRYRDHDWRDMSHFLVHLTDNREQLIAILRSMALFPGKEPAGFARQSGLGAPAVSLSEIPPDLLNRLASRQGQYGVAFHVDALSWSADRMGVHFGRVWYIEKATELSTRLWHLAKSAADCLERAESNSERQAFREVATFIDMPGEYEGTTRRFEWEREWRWGGVLPFALHDLRLVVAPETEHGAFAGNDNLPLIDATWPWDHIRSVVDAHVPRSPSRGWNPMRTGALRLWHDGTAWSGRGISHAGYELDF